MLEAALSGTGARIDRGETLCLDFALHLVRRADASILFNTSLYLHWRHIRFLDRGLRRALFSLIPRRNADAGRDISQALHRLRRSHPLLARYNLLMGKGDSQNPANWRSVLFSALFSSDSGLRSI